MLYSQTQAPHQTCPLPFCFLACWRMMIFANLLFGFFKKPHAGSEAGGADERRALSTFASASSFMIVQAHICKNIRWHLCRIRNCRRENLHDSAAAPAPCLAHKLALDGAKIHAILNNVEVIVQSECCGVDGRREVACARQACSLTLQQQRQEQACGPSLEDCSL
jgi:hypothetical protein